MSNYSVCCRYEGTMAAKGETKCQFIDWWGEKEKTLYTDCQQEESKAKAAEMKTTHLSLKKNSNKIHSLKRWKSEWTALFAGLLSSCIVGNLGDRFLKWDGENVDEKKVISLVLLRHFDHLFLNCVAVIAQIYQQTNCLNLMATLPTMHLSHSLFP